VGPAPWAAELRLAVSIPPFPAFSRPGGGVLAAFFWRTICRTGTRRYPAGRLLREGLSRPEQRVCARVGHVASAKGPLSAGGEVRRAAS
jgi:hypothetical protein